MYVIGSVVVIGIWYAVIAGLFLGTSQTTIDEDGDITFGSGPGFAAILISGALISLVAVLVLSIVQAGFVQGALRISRGSASMTLKALQEWGVVSRTHVRGDRREYFHAEQDVWKLFRTILRERKKREIDPLLEALRECRELTARVPAASSRRIGAMRAIEQHNQRLDSMLEFITMIDAVSERLIASGKGLQLAAKILAKAS